MLSILNESLKQDNILAVFRAVVDEGCETRSEIATSTGLSIVTAGKAVELFLDNGTFIQREKQTKSVGRHAGRIRPNPARNLAVIDLSKRNFQVMFYDLQLFCVYSNEYEYISDFSFPDNLCMFLHRVKSYMLGTKEIRYGAITLIVPGAYDQSRDTISGSGDGELEKIKVREFSKSMVGMPFDIVIDCVCAAARYCASNCRQDSNILYINTDNGIDARLIVKGRALRRNTACGALPVSERGLVEDICGTIRCICNISGISEVLIESEELRRVSDTADVIAGMLKKCCHHQQDIPLITVNSSVKYSCCGAALISRNYWLDKSLR